MKLNRNRTDMERKGNDKRVMLESAIFASINFKPVNYEVSIS